MAVTIKDIAKRTGLGLATISRYLNGGNVRPQNLAAIEEAIQELNYSRNNFAHGLKTRRSSVIGVVLPEIRNALFMEVITEMEYVLKKQGYAILISDCHNNKQKEMESVDFLLSKSVDGIVSFPLSRSGRHLAAALERNVPVLLVDRAIKQLSGKVDAVVIDNRRIACEAVRHLIGRGHRRIGIITSSRGEYTADERVRGYLDALDEAGIEPDPGLIIRKSFDLESGLEGYRKLLGKSGGVTAIFATSHNITMGVLMAAGADGKRVPRDISIVGFDAMDWLRIVNPPLTIVEQPMAQIGRLAAEILLRRLVGGGGEDARQTVILPAKLNFGASVRRLRP
ncbi:MAG: LacI family transcriptional regulator [Clostridiales Family XIII bacterium]|jgi:LacI family transcriptional regulator|nr:LacI family transcriptional regulator [Clostridiales Family XIII bacterium]